MYQNASARWRLIGKPSQFLWRLVGTRGDDGAAAGLFARAWSIGRTALWIAVLLSGYVLVYYV